MSQQDINITDPIFEWAMKAPYAVAIIEGKEVVHYRTLCTAVLRAMAAFQKAGWQPGQVIAISLNGSVALQLVVSLALARAGLTQVWLSLADPLEYRATRASKLGVAAVITDHEQGLLKPIAHLAPDVGWLSIVETDGAPAVQRTIGTDRALIIIQSSGTTGVPKDIAVSHEEETLLANRSNTACASLQGERFLSLIGVRFWTGLSRAWRCLSSGGTYVAPPATWTTEELLKFMDLHQVAFFACTPMHIQMLLKDIQSDMPRLPGLRILRCTSAALPLNVLREARRRISSNLYIYYGSNESGAIAAATPALLDRYPDCGGVPLEGVELQIVDESNQQVAAGGLGHIRVRVVGMRPSHFAESTPVGNSGWNAGWFYPGDVGVCNTEGVLFLKGRSDDMMNFDGIMVGPAEIESVLALHQAVADSAAFPLPSPVHQDIPAAAVVLRQSIPIEELARYCQQHLGIRAPRMFFVIDAIPRNPMGKVLRRRLTELAVAKVRSGTPD